MLHYAGRRRRSSNSFPHHHEVKTMNVQNMISILLLLLLAVLQAADAYLTWRILAAGGSERNKLLAILMLCIGVLPALVIFKLAMLVLAYLFLFQHQVLMVLIVILYVCVVAHNWNQLHKGGQG